MKMTFRERIKFCRVALSISTPGIGWRAPALIWGKSCWILLTATENDGRHAAPNTMMSGMQQQLANAMMGGNTTRQCNDGGIQIIG
jgi:hypothetical protein